MATVCQLAVSNHLGEEIPLAIEEFFSRIDVPSIHDEPCLGYAPNAPKWGSSARGLYRF